MYKLQNDYSTHNDIYLDTNCLVNIMILNLFVVCNQETCNINDFLNKLITCERVLYLPSDLQQQQHQQEADEDDEDDGSEPVHNQHQRHQPVFNTESVRSFPAAAAAPNSLGRTSKAAVSYPNIR